MFNIVLEDNTTVRNATPAQVIQAMEHGSRGTGIVFIHCHKGQRTSTLAYIFGSRRVVRDIRP